MLALIRPDSWDLPLFLHVLGAMILFGGTATVAIVGFASRTHREHAPLLARVALRTCLFGVVPGWILMRVGAGWIVGKEFPHDTPGWVDVGFIVSEPGALILIALSILAGVSVRRKGVGRAAIAVPVLAGIYLVALVIAWWAMSAKPGA
jgi:membrane protein YqaA with SNARE-associated domain